MPREILNDTQRSILREWTLHAAAVSTVAWAHRDCLERLCIGNAPDRISESFTSFERSVHCGISETVRNIAVKSPCNGNIDHFYKTVWLSTKEYFQMPDPTTTAVEHMLHLVRHHASDQFKAWVSRFTEMSESIHRQHLEVRQRLAESRRRLEEARQQPDEARQRRLEAERQTEAMLQRVKEKEYQLEQEKRRIEEAIHRRVGDEVAERRRMTAEHCFKGAKRRRLDVQSGAEETDHMSPTDQILIHTGLMFFRSKVNLSRLVWQTVVSDGRHHPTDTNNEVVATPVAVFTELHRMFTEDPGIRRTLERLKVTSVRRSTGGDVSILYAPQPPRGPTRYTVCYLADRLCRQETQTMAPIFMKR